MELTDYNTKEEKKAYLEGIAQGVWELLMHLGLEDGHCKSYDPLTIEQVLGQKELTAHSYVFDLNTGGRHHEYQSFQELYEDLLLEIKKFKPVTSLENQ